MPTRPMQPSVYALVAALALGAQGAACDKVRALRGGAPPTPATPAARGPGDFVLRDPSVGLRALAAVTQRLVVTTRPTRGDARTSVHARVVRAASNQELNELETVDQLGQPLRVLHYRDGRAHYVKTHDRTCTGAQRDDATTGSLGDPASELPRVLGAARVGDETYGGEASTRYTFDQRALRGGSELRAQGELRVATHGGFVVSYSLRATDPSGERTWTYTASRADAGAIPRPEGCGPVLTDLPAMPGATGEERATGELRYRTGEPLAAARRFHDGALAAAGWRLRAPLREDAAEALVLFEHPATQRLAVLGLRREGAETAVTLQVAEPVSPAAVAAAARDAPAAPAVALAPPVAALARYLPDALGDARASEPASGTTTSIMNMQMTMALRRYATRTGRLQVSLSRGDVARLARSAIAMGPTAAQRASGARQTAELGGAPAMIELDGSRAILQSVLEGGVLVRVELDGEGAAGAARVVALGGALDLAALRRIR